MNLNIIGHTKNKDYFEKMWKLNRLPHSLLFYGPKSVGKFSFTMNLAYQLLINNDISFKAIIPDESNAIKIKNLTHPNMLVIGSKEEKEITIDNIRNIKQFLSLTPAISLYRIVVIDNADKMNLNAQNALLKILEEPPKNSIIIVVSNSLEKLLTTITSRLIIVKFSQLTKAEIELIIDKKSSELNSCLKAGFTLELINKWLKGDLQRFYSLILHYLVSNKNFFKLYEEIENFIKKEKLMVDEILFIINLAIIRLINYSLKREMVFLVNEEENIFNQINNKFILENLLEIQLYISSLIADYYDFKLDFKVITILLLEKFHKSSLE